LSECESIETPSLGPSARSMSDNYNAAHPQRLADDPTLLTTTEELVAVAWSGTARHVLLRVGSWRWSA
jgi:hypothetical protein